MPVTEVLGQLGTFSLPFKSTVSGQALRNIWENGYRHLVITNSRRIPHIPTQDPRVVARYCGVIDSVSRTSVDGVSLAWYLSTDKGYSYPQDTDVYLDKGTLAQWVNFLIPPALTIGTITPSAKTVQPLTGTWHRVLTSRRQALDFVCAWFNVEWRITPMGVINFGDADTLYGQPRVLVSRDLSGRDTSINGLYAPDLSLRRSWEDYLTDIYAIWYVDDKGEITTDVNKGKIRQGHLSRANRLNWRDLKGNSIQIARYAERPSELLDWAVASWAVQQLAIAQQDNEVAEPGTVRARLVGAPGGDPKDATAGDWIYAYDPDQGISDPTFQVVINGHLITPWIMRCSTLTWKFVEGMGASLYRNESGEISSLDITDFLQPEDEAISIGFRDG